MWLLTRLLTWLSTHLALLLHVGHVLRHRLPGIVATRDLLAVLPLLLLLLLLLLSVLLLGLLLSLLLLLVLLLEGELVGHHLSCLRVVLVLLHRLANLDLLLHAERLTGPSRPDCLS